MSDDDFCDDAEEWKQIADSYAYELEDRDARIDELQARIEQLEAALGRIYAWYPISVTQPRQTIDEIRDFARAALEGKKDE